MKKTTLSKAALAGVLMSFLGFSALEAKAVLITFDDLGDDSGPIPNGYQGFNWNNLYHLNGLTYGSQNSGYTHGVISPANVAYNAFGSPGSVLVTMPGQSRFSATSMYMTSSWDNNNPVKLEGFRNGELVYTKELVLPNTVTPQFIEMNFKGIDELKITSYGGENADVGGSGNHVAMDNLVLNNRRTYVDYAGKGGSNSRAMAKFFDALPEDALDMVPDEDLPRAFEAADPSGIMSAPESMGTEMISSLNMMRSSRLASTQVGQAGSSRLERHARMASLADYLPAVSETLDLDVWGEMLGSTGRRWDGGVTSYRNEMYGAVVGIGQKIDEWDMGLTLTGYQGDVSFENGDNLKITSEILGLYGGWANEDMFANLQVDAGLNQYDSDRDTGARATFRGQTYSAFGEYGLNFVPAESWYIRPSLALQYVKIVSEGYAEEGGIAPMSFGRKSSDLVHSFAILRTGTPFETPWDTAANAEVRLAWQHELMGSDNTIDVGIPGGGMSNFRVNGVERDINSFHVGGGLKFDITEQWKLGLDYNFMYSQHAQQHTGLLTVTYEF